MNTTKPNSWIFYVAAGLAIAFALRGPLAGQTAAVESFGGPANPVTKWSLQVERIDPGNLNLAYSFQAAIYEELLKELNKTKQFKYVLREGDLGASALPQLLILKTTVVKYTPGSETRRAVTTVTGATKLTVRSQLLTREGKVVLERTVSGNVRFFGSNLRATHNVARNVAKMIKRSTLPGGELQGRHAPVNSDCERCTTPGSDGSARQALRRATAQC